MFVHRRYLRWCLLITFIVMAVWISGCSKKVVEKSSSQVQPEAVKQVEQLNVAADEMYSKVVEGDVTTARTKLNEIGDKLTQIRFNSITTVEGVQALTDSVVAAKRELNAVAYSKLEGQQAAARVRLATDALTHKHEPMWLQYYKGMKDNVGKLLHAVQAAKVEDALVSYNSLSEQYQVIRPSVIISRTPSEVERIESLFSFVNTQLHATRWDLNNITGGIDHLNTTLDLIFQRKDSAAFVPFVEPSNPVLSIAFLSAIIIAVLAFAAWRIFQVERNIVGGRSGKNRNDKFLK